MSKLPRTAGSPGRCRRAMSSLFSTSMTPIGTCSLRRRSDHHRLGSAVQLGTARAVGRFLEDPLDVPWPAVEFLAGQLAIGDPSCVKKYTQRSQTPYEHAWEIRAEEGYRSFDDVGSAQAGRVARIGAGAARPRRWHG